MINLQEHGLYGNKFYFEDLYRWIDTKVNNPCERMGISSCLILTGSPGIGKTYSIEKMCDILGVHIKRIDSTNCKSIKELSDIFIKMASTNLEEVLQQISRKKIILIDEFETMIHMDRNIPSVLYQLIERKNTEKRQLPYIPVIIACNDNMEKKLGDIKRYCKMIHLIPPTNADVILMLRSYTKTNNINVSANSLLQIAEICSGNMQHALQILQFEMLKKEETNCIGCKIDTMPNINVLYSNPSRKTAFFLFEEDTWMTPLRFHENLSKEMNLRKGTKPEKITIYSMILRCILDWDAMINGNEPNQIGSEMAITYLCNAPCYILPKLERKKRGDHPSLDEFTKALSHMSLQCKLKRHTHNDDFPWDHVGNYCYTIKNYKNKKFSDVDTDT